MKRLACFASLAAASSCAFAADEAAKLSGADTVWVLVSAVLVLLMTLPGIALFYGGMVRKKNVLGTALQSLAICCTSTIVWYTVGYSLAFSGGNGFIGDLDHAFLAGISTGSMHGTIPELAFVFFQMTFAVIATALVPGSFAGRMKFSSMVIFTTLWTLLCYVPVCHWVWSETGWLAADGALDFAGGTVVHINAGIAALVGCLVIGPRIGYGRETMAPHNLVLSIIGAALLWVGWMGFNGGSELAADGRAAMACLVTQIATAAAAIAWMGCEWIFRGRPTSLGGVSGAVAGLVAITPASGFVEPGAACLIGLIGGALCCWTATCMKFRLGYDDSLDAFGVHGVGGLAGALLTGVFVSASVSGSPVKPMLEQVWIQTYSCLATIVYTAAVSFILYKAIDKTVGLRMERDEERQGMDISLHGERIE